MKLNNIDLNKLAVFSQVVESGNYRIASEILNVTPSALSQAISSLEHGLGFMLFHRVGKKLIVSAEGLKLQREFKKYHGGLTSALEEIAGLKSQVSGLIHIGSYLEFAKFQLAPVLSEFQQKHPALQVKLHFDTPSRLHALLEAGKLDICFSIFPERGSKLILSRPLYRQELLLASPSGMIAERASFAEVSSAPMVEYYFNHQPIRRWLWLHYRKKPKVLPVRTYAATAEMVLALIREGLGIGVVPEYLLRVRPARGLTVCRPTSRRLIDHIWMLQAKHRGQSAALDALTAELERVF